MGELVDDPRDEQYFREQILASTGFDGTGWVGVELAEAGQHYSIEFTRDEMQVVSECCASTPSLLEAREIYNALGAWLKIQDEKEK